MSSRSERQKKLYRPIEPVVPSREQRIAKAPIIDRGSRLSGQVRTISPKTWKIIVITSIVLLLLLLTSPKPPTPPGKNVQGANTKFESINLKSIKTTIPPVNTSSENAIGNTLKEKLKIK